MSNMNLLVVILKHEDLVSEICKELVEEGIHGGTIVDGTGMASVVEKMDDLPIFGMLRSILADDDDHEVVKMMFFVVDDEEMKKARKTINDVIGLDKPNTGIMFAETVPYCDIDLEPYAYDVEQAQSMLDEAGWVVGADKIREKDGQKLNIDLLYNSDSVTEKAIAEYLQSEYQKIGISSNKRKVLPWSFLPPFS